MKVYMEAPQGATVVQNAFIDRYMIQANGEFVKIYLYLLRQAQEGKEISAGLVADVLECTENDVKRAVQYWEKLQLIRIECGPDKSWKALTFTDAAARSAEPAAHSLKTDRFGTRNKDPENREAVTALESGNCLTAARIAELSGQEEVRQLFFVADSYLQRPLSSTEQEDLLYYYDSLHFSIDLIEYLLEYCISKGSASRHYIRKVAMGWAEAGVRTVSQAKKESALYNKDFYTIMNAFGLRGRHPAAQEQEMMSHWLNELDFTMDIILEACSRTVLQTHEPSFPYANKILEDWHEQKVHSLNDIRSLDAAHASRQEKPSGRAAQPPRTGGQKTGSRTENRFNNFTQREYNYSQLESRLLQAGASAASGEVNGHEHK